MNPSPLSRPRAFLLLLVLTVGVGRSATALGAAAGSATRPHVVLILADDLGFGDPRCYNPTSKIPTPHLDRLAAQGMRFTDAHTPSSVCTPTRYGLLTGRYSWRSSLKRGVLLGYSPALLEPGRFTLPALLAQAGYQTHGIGKWHLGLGNAPRTDYAAPLRPGPLEAGFQHYFGLPASLDMDPYLYFEDDAVIGAPTARVEASAMRRHGGGGYWRAGAIAPDFRHEDVLPRLRDRAVEVIRGSARDQPFFLYLALTAPHTPWMPTAAYRGRSGAGWYGDFVVQVDDTVGAVLNALDQTGLRRRSLVIFTSDNGAHWLPADITQFGHRANGAWRGQKADVWEGGHRVPFIVRWPARVKAGSTSRQLVCLTDVLATLAEVVRLPLPEGAGEDSQSFLPVLLGRKASSPLRQTVVHHSSEGFFAIREGPWKLCLTTGSGGFSHPRNPTPQAGEPSGQLYHLDDDPAEQRNLWAAHPDVVERLQHRLESIRESGRFQH